ncbi:MAG: patatin-like phospholipase family protein [Lutibacter sp.]
MIKKIQLLFLWIPFVVFSQVKDTTNLKVGVVLSGGGAKGFAHVAVLKVLEDAGIQVNYIGGTSMGAIIGGLYASGYTASQLDSILKSLDYEAILSGKLPRKSLPFNEKENGEKYAVILPIKNKKIGIPKALSGGQNLLNLLSNLTQHVNQISDFNKLPIPFLCIATNLENGQQEVLRKGFLPLAMKASGSFPTLLAPVEMNGKLLTDGGIVNNFPVKEVRDMGADIVIGVDLQSGLDKKEDLDSAVKILNQIVGFEMYNKKDTLSKKVDVLIKPNVQNFNVVSFNSIAAIMKAGDSAAKSKLTVLKEIAKKQTKSKSIKPVSTFKKFKIDNINVEGNSNYTRAYMLGKLNLKKSDSLNYNRLESCINNVTATRNFESIQYFISDTKKGKTLNFKVKENPINNYLKIGIHYDDLYKTGVLLNVTTKHLLAKNDVLSSDFILGDNVRYNINYFIDNGFYWSVGLRSRFNSFNADVNFELGNVKKLNIDYEDFTNQFYVQTVFSRKFGIELGAEHKSIKAFTETVSSLDSITSNKSRFYFDKSNYFNAFAAIKIDTYDKKYYQKRGFYLNAILKWYLGSTDYNKNFNTFSQFTGKLGVAFPVGKYFSALFESEAGVTIGNNENIVLQYKLGSYGQNFINDFVPLYGFDFAQFTGNSFLRSALTLRYEIFPKNYLMTSGNFGRIGDDLLKGGKIFDNTKSGFMVGYGVDTFFGPVEIHYAWSPDHSKKYWYFNVGYWF